jgi:hypothetical protein
MLDLMWVRESREKVAQDSRVLYRHRCSLRSVWLMPEPVIDNVIQKDIQRISSRALDDKHHPGESHAPNHEPICQEDIGPEVATYA